MMAIAAVFYDVLIEKYDSKLVTYFISSVSWIRSCRSDLTDVVLNIKCSIEYFEQMQRIGALNSRDLCVNFKTLQNNCFIAEQEPQLKSVNQAVNELNKKIAVYKKRREEFIGQNNMTEVSLISCLHWCN